MSGSTGAAPRAIADGLQSFLALDFGLKRTGFAVGNRLLRTAQPQGSIAAEGDARFARIAEQLRIWQPDALVSDIGMPLEDGYALIRRVRALSREQGGQVPAVALTAFARSEDREQALEAGYQLHLPKPVNLSELVAAVVKVLDQK